MSVHPFPLAVAAGLASSNEDIAQRLHEFADQLEQGQFGEADQVICIVTGNQPISRHTYGKPMNVAELCGVLFMAASTEAFQ